MLEFKYAIHRSSTRKDLTITSTDLEVFEIESISFYANKSVKSITYSKSINMVTLKEKSVIHQNRQGIIETSDVYEPYLNFSGGKNLMLFRTIKEATNWKICDIKNLTHKVDKEIEKIKEKANNQKLKLNKIINKAYEVYPEFKL